MHLLALFLFILAIVLAVLAAWGVPSRVGLLALSVASFAGAMMTWGLIINVVR